MLNYGPHLAYGILLDTTKIYGHLHPLQVHLVHWHDKNQQGVDLSVIFSQIGEGIYLMGPCLIGPISIALRLL